MHALNNPPLSAPYPQKCYSADSSMHGVGVFASEGLSPGEIIEVCQYRWIPMERPWRFLCEEGWEHVVFRPDPSPGDDGGFYIAWGHAMLYNEARGVAPNAEFIVDTASKILTVKAVLAVPQDEELLVTYAATTPEPHRPDEIPDEVQDALDGDDPDETWEQESMSRRRFQKSSA